MRRGLFWLTALIMSLFLPVAAVAAETTGVTENEITIGMTCPMSGPAALWSAMALGNAAWAKHINAQGGIHGRKIKFVVKDDGYNPSRALANLMEMKNDVFMYVCLNGSASANASKDFILTSKIPFVSILANPRIWVGVPADQMRYVFNSNPDTIDEGEAITHYMVSKMGVKTLALFGQNDEWGKSSDSGIRKAMNALGSKAQYSGFVTYELTDRAVGGHALRLKELNAEAVFITAAPVQAALIIKEMAKLGYKPKIFTTNPLGDPLMFKLVGPQWEGTYPASAANVSMPGLEPAADRVIEILLKHEPSLKGREYLALCGATSMMLAAEGLKRVGKNPTREGFVKAMESIKDFKCEGMGAPITFSATRHHGLNGFQICQAKDGKHVPITDYILSKPLF
jgi:branched-chain amino acid transport system substrate-binding protein